MDFNQGAAIARGLGLIYKKFYADKHNEKPVTSNFDIPKSKQPFDQSMIADALGKNNSSSGNGLLIAGGIVVLGLCLLEKVSKPK